LRWFRIEVPDDRTLRTLAARLEAEGYPAGFDGEGLFARDPAGLAVRVTPPEIGATG